MQIVNEAFTTESINAPLTSVVSLTLQFWLLKQINLQ